MPGIPVNFEAQVNKSVNRALLVRVAEASMQELKVCHTPLNAHQNLTMWSLKTHSTVHAEWMNAPSVKLTPRVLCEFTKKSFRGFKVQYEAQFNAEKATQLKVNEQSSRWQSRRNTVCAPVSIVLRIALQ